MPGFRTFGEFYPYYLGEHRHVVCRRLHFAGTALALACLVAAGITQRPALLLGVPLAGYGFAWVGHFVFERNHPATFRHPLYSAMGDMKMFLDILRGRIAL